MKTFKIPHGAQVVIEMELGKFAFYKSLNENIIPSNPLETVPCSMVWEDGEWKYSFLDISSLI